MRLHLQTALRPRASKFGLDPAALGPYVAMAMPNRLTSIFRQLLAALLGVLMACGLLLGLATMMSWGGRDLDSHPGQRAKHGNGKGPKIASRLNFLPSRPVELLPEPAKPKPREDDDMNGQIVETARPERDEAPDHAKYLGRYDMKVDREQKALGRKTPGRDLGKMAIDNPSRLQSPQSTSKEATQLPRQRQVVQTKKGENQPDQQAVAAANMPGAGPAPQEAHNQGQNSSVVVQGAPNGLLLPSTSPGNVLRNLQALSGSPGSNDYLPDVDDEGATNLLNTRKFRYWDFFQRVKDRVGQEWEPGKVWNERDPTGQRYGVKNRLTLLRVTLDPEGALKQLRVAKECGLDFLDDEARRAFTAASPFPNPPSGLRNDHGEIEFQFGFMFEISSQRFKMRGWQ